MKIERIQCGNGNCFLIHSGVSAILVDTSRTQYRDAILAKCRQRAVKLILLTHGHIDHVQNAAFLANELNVPIAMHKADLPLLADSFAEPVTAHKLLGKAILALSMKSFREDKADSFEPAVFLSEGDSLSEYGFDACIIELPGHTKGSIGVVAGKNDVLVGDALMNIARPQKSLLYADWEAVKRSAERISGLGDATIHFGHGKSAPNRKW
jgi:glyoxylase-like metal-dependent hydrolase (beta-lactamase superfamily II)